MKLRSSHGPFSSEDVSKYFDIAVAAEGGAVIVSDLKSWRRLSLPPGKISHRLPLSL